MIRILTAAFIVMLVAAIAVVLGVPALAQTAAPAEAAGGDMRAKLLGMDTDHDGKWSRAEWLAGGRKARGFDMIDADHDGFLTIDELRSGREKMKAMREAMGK